MFNLNLPLFSFTWCTHARRKAEIRRLEHNIAKMREAKGWMLEVVEQMKIEKEENDREAVEMTEEEKKVIEKEKLLILGIAFGALDLIQALEAERAALDG